MIDAVSVQRPYHADVVGVFGDVRKKVANLQPRFASRTKPPHRWQQRILRNFPACHHVSKAVGQWLAAVFSQRWLGIKQVHMARATMHEQPDHPLRSWGDVLQHCGAVTVCLSQRGICQHSGTATRANQKLAS